MVLFVSLGVHAQTYNTLANDQKRVDSLRTLLSAAKSDSLKCILSFKLASVYYKNNDLKRSISFLNAANRLAPANTYLSDLSYYYNAMFHARLSADKKELDAFRIAYEKANLKLKKYHTKEIYSIRSTILFNLALAYQRQNNDLEAIKIILDEAIPVAKKADDKIEMANLYRFLGLIFYNKDDLIKADQYVYLAIKTLELKVIDNQNYTENLLEFYLFYIEILSQQNKLVDATHYLKKANKILFKYPDSNLYMEYYSAAGTLEHQSRRYHRAITFFNKGISKALVDKDSYAVLNFKLLKFESMKQLKRYPEAKNLLLEILSSKDVNIEDQRNYSRELSIIYKALGDPANALRYSERYIAINDSLDKVSRESQITNLEARYKYREHANKIRELEIQKEKALLTSRNNRMNYIVFGLISFILLLTTIFLMKNSKNQKRIADQKEINYGQQLNALEIQKQLDVTQAVISSEEAERKRIARDLHDGIGSRLSSLKMQIATIKKSTVPAESLDNFSDLLSQSMIELRQIAFNLMPETLLKLGLEMALKDLCHSLGTEKTTITFQANHIEQWIKAKDQIAIFRIVQELLINALKHSNCSEIIVDCSQNQDLFLITVEDNGKGFDTSNLEAFEGLGLKSIRNRVELLRGKLEVTSDLSKGTVFDIELKLHRHEH